MILLGKPTKDKSKVLNISLNSVKHLYSTSNYTYSWVINLFKNSTAVIIYSIIFNWCTKM